MRGLCNVCLSSNVEIVVDKGKTICQTCLKGQKKD